MFDTEELILNMGPQHPSTHGVLRLVLKPGRRARRRLRTSIIGYLHRGIEKLSENRDYTQIILLTDRMDYVAAATNNLGYVETIEKLYAIEVPRRANAHPHDPGGTAADRQPPPVGRHAARATSAR